MKNTELVRRQFWQLRGGGLGFVVVLLDLRLPSAALKSRRREGIGNGRKKGTDRQQGHIEGRRAAAAFARGEQQGRAEEEGEVAGLEEAGQVHVRGVDDHVRRGDQGRHGRQSVERFGVFVGQVRKYVHNGAKGTKYVQGVPSAREL